MVKFVTLQATQITNHHTVLKKELENNVERNYHGQIKGIIPTSACEE